MPTDAPDRVIRLCDVSQRPCPADPCPGEGDRGICDHWNRLSAWRAIAPAEQAARANVAGRVVLDPRVRDAVIRCPDRGLVLPISEQDDCGCQGRERTFCRAGQGARPGKVTLAECLACQGARVLALGAGG